MVVLRVHLAAAKTPAAADVEAVRLLVDVAAHQAETLRERGDPVALLYAELLRAADAQFAPMGRQRGEDGQLVDHTGHVRRHDLGRAQAPVTNLDGSNRFA